MPSCGWPRGPIQRKYAEKEEPDEDLFMGQYGKHVRHTPMEVTDLTGANLRARLKRMSPRTATSVDGWAAVDLKAMHLKVWDLPAELLGRVEELGVWPDRLAEGFISLVPKGEGAEALKLRPLSVLSTVYRLWAGLRLRDAMRWQESWIHAEAYGFRTGRSAEDAAAVLLTLLELARATGRSLSGNGLDYKKCFDLVPQRIALRLAQEFRMAPGALRAVRGMYRQLRRAFKVLGCLGDRLQATNGILQGCPLSVILINMLTTVWKREIDTLNAGFKV